MLPFAGRAGFTKRESIGLDSAVTLLCWYGVIFLASLAGFALARRHFRGRIALLDQIPNDTFYRVITAIAAIGVILSYAVVLAPDPDLLIRTVRYQQVNEIKRALYADYHVGLFTLRYVSAIGGGIAVFRALSRRKVDWWDVANILLLGLAAFFSARLLLIVAALLVLALFYHHGPERRLSLPHLATAAILLFLVLTPLNYVRNAGFYRDYYGEHNPFVMNLSEIRTYVGSPVQASIGVAEKDLSEDQDFSGRLGRAFDFIRPSYFEEPESSIPYYRDKIDLDWRLSTNSAFVSMYGGAGALAFPLIGVLCFVGALFIGHFLSYKSYVFLSGAVLLYAFAELWRISLFDEGVIHALVLVPVAVALGYGIFLRLRDRASRRLRAHGSA
jgi:hypothetical protein